MRKSSVKILSNQYEKDTTPIFTIFSDDTESKKTDSNSNIEKSSNSPRRWTQVLCAFKIFVCIIKFEEFRIQNHFCLLLVMYLTILL